MSAETKIEWADSTVNPTIGCDGCELWNPDDDVRVCYAGKLTRRFGRSNRGLGENFDEVVTAPYRMKDAADWPDLRGQQRLGKSWLNGLPRLIFIGDMADSFARGIPFDYLRDEVLGAVTSEAGRRHQWQWLTKQPKRMAEFSSWLQDQGIKWPENLWPGTSLTTQSTTARINDLLKVGDNSTTLRFVSVEPQWEPILLTRWLPWLNWVIQGGTSGCDSHPFDLDWVEALQEQCSDAKVPYFLKQLGTRVVRGGKELQVRRGNNGDWTRWPSELRVRQMPLSAVNVQHDELRQRAIACRQ